MSSNVISEFLDKKFSRNRRVTLGALIVRTKAGAMMDAGVLVVMASGDRRLRLKVLEKDTAHRGFSEPLVLNEFAIENKVTTSYLFWFLSQSVVAEYLIENASGAVFLRVPNAY